MLTSPITWPALLWIWRQSFGTPIPLAHQSQTRQEWPAPVTGLTICQNQQNSKWRFHRVTLCKFVEVKPMSVSPKTYSFFERVSRRRRHSISHQWHVANDRPWTETARKATIAGPRANRRDTKLWGKLRPSHVRSPERIFSTFCSPAQLRWDPWDRCLSLRWVDSATTARMLHAAPRPGPSPAMGRRVQVQGPAASVVPWPSSNRLSRLCSVEGPRSLWTASCAS